MAGAKPNGYIYDGKPILPGYSKIVQASQVVSVILVLEDGSVAFGDCVDVILAGTLGRDPLFLPSEHLDFLNDRVAPIFVGRTVDLFRDLAEEMDGLRRDGGKAHTAIRYGVTQALLNAAALARREPMVKVVAREYGTKIATAPIPILTNCGREDYMLQDRMIVKRVDLLPHAAFTNVEAHIGNDGGKLVSYAKRVASRIQEIGDPDYHPRIHLDVYGTIGKLFSENVGNIADYLGTLEEASRPFDLLIECPVLAGSRDRQIELFRGLRQAIRNKGIHVKIIADDWCNTLEDIRAFADAEATDLIQIKTPDLGGINNSIKAVLFCKEKGIGTCLGGSGNETDQSSRITTHIGLACNPDFLLSKPGLGGDEGLMIQTNEMSRTLALLKSG